MSNPTRRSALAKDIKIKFDQRIWNKFKYSYEDKSVVLPLTKLVLNISPTRVISEVERITMMVRDFNENSVCLNVGKTFFPGRIPGVGYTLEVFKLNMDNLARENSKARAFKVDHFIKTVSHGLWHISSSFYYSDPWEEFRWFNNRDEHEPYFRSGKKKVFENHSDGFNFSGIGTAASFNGISRLTIMDPIDFRTRGNLDEIWG